MTKLPPLIFLGGLKDCCGSSFTAMSHSVPAFMGKFMPGSMLTSLGVIWTVGEPELLGPVLFSWLETAYESRIRP